MRFILLVGAFAVLAGCATSSSPGSNFESRLPAMEAVVKAARAQPWGADLKQIPATVIEVGELASVPYLSFAGDNVELNVYGDPAKVSGIEVGTKNESPEFRASLRTFIGGLLTEADRKPLDTIPEGKEAVADGLALEITPPTAADGFGAWWVTASHPAGIAGAKATVGEMNEMAQAAPEEDFNQALAIPDVGAHMGFYKYNRFRPTGKLVYATSYFKKDGVYQRRK
jgi:hypothetical protein